MGRFFDASYLSHTLHENYPSFDKVALQLENWVIKRAFKFATGRGLVCPNEKDHKTCLCLTT